MAIVKNLVPSGCSGTRKALSPLLVTMWKSPPVWVRWASGTESRGLLYLLATLQGLDPVYSELEQDHSGTGYPHGLFL